MYCGHDKFGGAVVGGAVDGGDGGGDGDGGGGGGEDIMETLENACMEETVVAEGEDEEGNALEVLLTAHLDTENGGLAWAQEHDSQQTYKSVIAMSQMTSMLHDTSRNEKYDRAISLAVADFIRLRGRAPIVLDVGTGTGLLAMMAARAGAQHIYACEVFPSLAALASNIVAANGLSASITVISKLSTNLVVGGPEGDLPRKADMLISEILDSALLGEGVLPFLRHALTELVEQDAVVVPQSAQMFAQLIDSPCLSHFHDLTAPLTGGDHGPTLMRNARARSCRGGRLLLPIHQECMRDPPRSLTDPVMVFSLDLSSPSKPASQRSQHTVSFNEEGTASGVLMWWTLQLYGGVTYSTRLGCEGWQDHWLQTVFPLTPALQVRPAIKSEGLRGGAHQGEGAAKKAKATESMDTSCALPVAHSQPATASSHPSSLSPSSPEEAGTSATGTGDEKFSSVVLYAFHNDTMVWFDVDTSPAPVLQRKRAGRAKLVRDALADDEGKREDEGGAPESGLDNGIVADVREAGKAAGEEGTVVEEDKDEEEEEEEEDYEPLSCTCGWHTLCGAQRIASLSDRSCSSLLGTSLQSILKSFTSSSTSASTLPATATPTTTTSTTTTTTTAAAAASSSSLPAHPVCVDVSDGSRCALLLASLGATRVFSVETKPFSNIIMSQVCAANDYDERWTILDSYAPDTLAEALEGSSIDLLCAEPFYYQMQNFTMYQALNFWAIRSRMQPLLSPHAVIFPRRAFVVMALVHLENLGVSHGLAGVVCGFDHALLDATQQGWERRPFPYPLGMYAHRLLSEPEVVMTMDFTASIHDAPAHATTTTTTLTCTATADSHTIATPCCHGVVSWVTYDLDGTHTLSTAPRPAPDSHKQLVRFLQPFRSLAAGERVHVTTTLDVERGQIDFDLQ